MAVVEKNLNIVFIALFTLLRRLCHYILLFYVKKKKNCHTVVKIREQEVLSTQ